MKAQSGPKTVVVLNDFCYPNGGASRIAIDEAVGLAHANVRTIFFGAVGPVCDELASSQVEVICLDQPELVTAVDNPAVAFQALWNRAAARRLEQELASLDPSSTIIHLHGYGKALSASPIRAALQRKFALVCTLHDYFSACPNGGLFNYVEGRPCMKKCMSLDCVTSNCDKRHYTHKLYRVARTALYQTLGDFPRGIKNYIALSQRSRELLRPYLPSDARYFSLSNVVAVQRTGPAPVAQHRHLIAVGRLDPEKGIELLLQACREENTDLILVGDGPLRRHAEATPGVRVTGWLPREQVLAHVARARCLAFPSLWYETYGLVVDEAASMGVPAIVSDVTAAAERMVHGVHGWKFRSGDLDALKGCIAAAKDDVLLSAAGEAAFEQFWSKPPTMDHHLSRLLDIYRSILSSEESMHSSQIDQASDLLGLDQSSKM